METVLSGLVDECVDGQTRRHPRYEFILFTSCKYQRKELTLYISEIFIYEDEYTQYILCSFLKKKIVNFN
jgi:hypothetical protein